jgi:exopolysaccharide biosynthesis polyprenyl glycosylphosphotransferase
MRAQLRTVRAGAARVTRLFDALFALSLMVVTFTFVSTGRLSLGVDEFLVIRFSVENVALAFLFIFIWHACFAAVGLDRAEPHRSLRGISLRIVAACMASGVLSLFALASATGASDLHLAPYFWLVAMGVGVVGRTAIAAGARYAERRPRDVKHVVIVGSGPLALRVYESIRARRIDTDAVVGFVDTREPTAIAPEIRPRVIATLDEFEALVSRQPVDEVLIALPVKSQYGAIQNVIEACERVGVEVKYSSHFFAVSRARHAFDEEDGVAGVRLKLVADDHRLLIKRSIDVVGALCGLVVLSPVLFACAIAVKLTSPGPVIFSQQRYGRNRRLFRMYKFRTMVEDAEQLQSSLESQNEASGPVFKMKHDPRVTPVGRWLRRLSLDEVPQLVNVLNGDMSLVGPRPLPVRDVSNFNETWLLRRFSVKPGLTCLWQINGRNHVDFDHWVRLDLYYIDNWSLLLDMRILLKTVPAVLSRSGAM